MQWNNIYDAEDLDDSVNEFETESFFTENEQKMENKLKYNNTIQSIGSRILIHSPLVIFNLSVDHLFWNKHGILELLYMYNVLCNRLHSVKKSDYKFWPGVQKVDSAAIRQNVFRWTNKVLRIWPNL